MTELNKSSVKPFPDHTHLPCEENETCENLKPFSPLPDYAQLAYENGALTWNFQEHPQSILLTDSIQPILQSLHPDGQYCIGQDSGIYWRITEPPQRGAEAPDWFYVPNVPPDLNGEMRRSYVLWQEHIPPQIILEFVSGDGSEERDRTPWQGKFWIYETVIRPAYYGIYEVQRGSVEVYRFSGSRYELVSANQRGHFSIRELGVELGIWQGVYQNVNLPWLRWWDRDGILLLTGEERAEQERQRAEQEHQRAEREHQRAERLAARLRELGIDPDESE